MPGMTGPRFPRRGAGSGIALLLAIAGHASIARSQTWSVTELQYQGGVALNEHPVSPAGQQHILTLQHASGWQLGENFFFVDMICCAGAAGNRDMYLEWYPYLSLGAVTGRDLSWGPVRGLGPLGGVNWGAQAKVLKITPGFRLQLDLPGFAFANLDYLFLVDRNAGVAEGGAPKESGSHMVDFNWALPFKVGGASFSLEGHGEWRGPSTTDFGTRTPYWVLLQPQLRLDIGELLFDTPGRLLAGTEFQVWINKFGLAEADEVLPQFLLVYRF